MGQTTTGMPARGPAYQNGGLAYDHWLESLRLPVYRGFFIGDLRTIELAPWKDRGCDVAFIQLAGQEGMVEARVSEIAPGATVPPLKLAVDEMVYVVEGRGLSTVWAGTSGPKKTFEWQKHSLFLVPHNYIHQHSNAQGDQPARLLQYNTLPLAMSAVPDLSLLINGTGGVANPLDDEDLHARAVQVDGGRVFWYGSFFPDMRVWDKLSSSEHRGAGSSSVFIGFPGSEMSCHLSEWPARTYLKAHRHGPGRVIVIPSGEGYSVMWPEGQEKVVVPWHEGSMFVPPDQWFHQHFNVGSARSRYLALHPLAAFMGNVPGKPFLHLDERGEDRQGRNQIEYTLEDPWIRERFESELAKRGLSSEMPDDAYRIPGYRWKEDRDA